MVTTRSLQAKGKQLAVLIAALERNAQRATYGAVGAFVGLPAQSVMSGQPKSHRNSWVVSSRSHLPTGYSQTERHPRLQERPNVISTSAGLAAWLKANP